MGVKHIVVALVILASARALGQLSGTVTAGLGYHQNPLYNYEMLSDQIHEGMIDLRYLSGSPGSQIGVGYVGGLMIFNRFEARNYYEHALSIRFDNASGPAQSTPSTQNSGEEEQEEEEVPPGVIPDSSYSYHTLAMKGSGRYDKTAYEAYDNSGIELLAAYRFPVWQDGFIRLVNQAGYRSYTNLSVLTNMTDLFTFQLGTGLRKQAEIGGRASVGLKHFTTATYDTSLYDIQSAQSKSHGKGKGVGQGSGNIKKSIIANAGSTNSFYATFGFYGIRTWATGSLHAELLYAITPGSGGRYLAQYAQTSILSSDIYNDFFSYAGPSFGITVRQTLVYGIQWTAGVEWGRRQFVAAALDLDANVIADQRVDIRSELALGISRYFEMGETVGLDLSLTGTLLRNQSNDDYNDYSASGVSLSLGFGF